MAADTYSARLGLLRQATGNNNNNWGDKFNSSVTDLLDLALFGTESHAVTGGTLDFSTGTQPPNGPGSMIGAVQAFTGNLTSQQTVVLPALQGRWSIFNNTAGNFTLIVKTPTGSPIEIPQGTIKDIVSDGVNVYRKDRDQVGKIHYNASATNAAIGSILCTGQSLLRTDYPYLFSIIGTTFGAADGLHFSVPNLYDTGRYLRSTTASLALGTYQSNQVGTHTHTYSGTTATENASHSHFVSGTTGTMNSSTVIQPTPVFAARAYGGFGNQGAVVTGIQINNGSDGSITWNTINIDHTHNFSASTGTESAAHGHSYSGTTGATGGSETRPESMAAIAAIVF